MIANLSAQTIKNIYRHNQPVLGAIITTVLTQAKFMANFTSGTPRLIPEMYALLDGMCLQI